ncbi:MULTISPECIES: hypothetical protein [unclassified Mucilaginibacter]|uniref:hypothetical protein n=1 Tax=unclassified Mucilaginibacter TaxID=2617802 RepID=UPI002AC9B245|nr:MULTISPECIES: hypothetical protein [unclassified Mucilaginibacter]MEB0260758.1 hypothetical protein [Mucilaginibacter sp. 10I4]MEB0302869.1 hypothetical protein [Mucilaginibacter sp. 5C4]WPX22137.1 hypothetical protein RHM67_12680 [Mucilaginibacter sp. 5C4]
MSKINKLFSLLFLAVLVWNISLNNQISKLENRVSEINHNTDGLNKMERNIELLQLNQKNLYSNDSLIVVKQNQYQSKQEVKGFLSLLLHML